MERVIFGACEDLKGRWSCFLVRLLTWLKVWTIPLVLLFFCCRLVEGWLPSASLNTLERAIRVSLLALLAYVALVQICRYFFRGESPRYFVFTQWRKFSLSEHFYGFSFCWAASLYSEINPFIAKFLFVRLNGEMTLVAAVLFVFFFFWEYLRKKGVLVSGSILRTNLRGIGDAASPFVLSDFQQKLGVWALALLSSALVFALMDFFSVYWQGVIQLYALWQSIDPRDSILESNNFFPGGLKKVLSAWLLLIGEHCAVVFCKKLG